MKKSILFYLFAVVCTVCLFTACSDDDDDDKTVTTSEIAGTYQGQLKINLTGSILPASIKVTKVSDSKVNVSLSDFSIPGLLPTAIDINADCDVKPAGDDLKLSGTTSIDLTSAGVGKVDVAITGEADRTDLDLLINVTKLGVSVTFDGQK